MTDLLHTQHLADDSFVASISLELRVLRPGVQLRVGKINPDHVNSIALSGGKWPPILVRRTDHTIIDGHYRYLAACQLGLTQVECIYFDGGEDSAFLEALRLNRAHGLPLSLRDREAAARHVLGNHPDWSDRRVATTCGLAQGTVRRLRAQVHNADDDGPLQFRVGRDGRRRPVDPKASRSRVITALRAHPEGTVSNIARLTGVSPTTVRAVKADQDQELNDRTRPTSSPVASRSASVAWITDGAILSAANGESFVKWFERTSLGPEWRGFVLGIPVSRIYEVADEARRRASEWLEFASMLEERVRGHRSVNVCI